MNSDIATAVRDNFACLVLALRLDIEALPANDRRLKIAAALAKIDAGVQELEAALK